MKTNPAFCRERLSRSLCHPFLAIVTAGLLLLGPGIAPALGGPILLGAPTGSGSYYGMYSPNVSAASFTLNASYNISTIDVVLRTPSSSSFTTFDFSLQDALASPAHVYASQALTAPVGATSTEVMNVNAILPAGTYYLTGIIPGYFGTTVTPGNVDGWLLSTGAYNQTAGTIANGVWVGGSPPTFYTGGVYVAPAFTVNGSPVPEPSTLAILCVGTVVFCAFRRRK